MCIACFTTSFLQNLATSSLGQTSGAHCTWLYAQMCHNQHSVVVLHGMKSQMTQRAKQHTVRNAVLHKAQCDVSVSKSCCHHHIWYIALRRDARASAVTMHTTPTPDIQYRARGWVATELECNSTQKISLFETNIRVVGGLLGAYDLSGDHLFLDKAVQCVDLMLPIFDTSPTGMPQVQLCQCSL